MRLRVLLPTRVLVDTAPVRVTADGQHGSFTVLPRHVDTLAALVPGLLSFESVEGDETFVAVDGGLLVKYGPDVLVSTRRAVTGRDLHTLRDMVEREFHLVDDRERMARGVMARLEADFVRRFMALEDRPRA